MISSGSLFESPRRGRSARRRAVSTSKPLRAEVVGQSAQEHGLVLDDQDRFALPSRNSPSESAARRRHGHPDVNVLPRPAWLSTADDAAVRAHDELDDRQAQAAAAGLARDSRWSTW